MVNEIKKVLELNKAAFDAVKNGYRRGMSENDIKKLILSSVCGFEDFSGDIVSGMRSALIEGDATDYVPQEGDTLILDLQFKFGGVWSDNTRTFFIGEPSSQQRKAYELIKDALSAGERALVCGNTAGKVYEAVREALAPHQLNFPHHAGHLFGKERVMQPQLLPEKKDILTENMAVCLEPGLYFENSFGIRLENNYLITEHKALNLFDYTLEISDFIL